MKMEGSVSKSKPKRPAKSPKRKAVASPKSPKGKAKSPKGKGKSPATKPKSPKGKAKTPAKSPKKAPKSPARRKAAAKSPREASKDKSGDKSAPMSRKTPKLPSSVCFDQKKKKFTTPIPLSASAHYQMLDNMGRPFFVFHDDAAQQVHVYKLSNWEKPALEYQYFYTFNDVEKLFPGEDPNGDWAGNTVLFKLKNGNYVVFEREFKEFTPFAEIVKYVSPVGNSGVPYPYAFDTAGNFYFFPGELALTNSANDYETLIKEWSPLFDDGPIPGRDKTKLKMETVIRRHDG